MLVKRQYNHIALGGTFEYFHLGHKKLLVRAFALSKFVTIGLVSSGFAIKLGKKPYEGFEVRRNKIISYLLKKKLKNRFSVIKLDDIFGNTLSDGTLDGLLVTRETLSGAQLINQRREELGLQPLNIVILNYFSSGGGRISSSLVRKGHINEKGFNLRKFLIENNFSLPDSLRQPLSQPFGKILKKVPLNRDGCLITVGDATTYQFLKEGIVPDLSIIDLNIQRKKAYNKLEDLGFKQSISISKVNNAAGKITSGLSVSISSAYRQTKKFAILVIGEEDLAAIPAVLLAPIPATVYYGLRNTGLIEIKVNPDSKELFLKVLRQFRRTLVNLSGY